MLRGKRNGTEVRVRRHVRADDCQLRPHWLLLHPLVDGGNEFPERRNLLERARSIGGVIDHDVHEAHAVRELECRVAKSLRLFALELFEYLLHEPFILGRELGLHAIADHCRSHFAPPKSTGMTTTANGVPPSSLTCGATPPNGLPPSIAFV